MKRLQAGCVVSELRSTSDKLGKSILNILVLWEYYVVLWDDKL